MLHGPRQTWEFLSSAASKINLFLISASLTGSYASEPQTYGVQNSDKTDNVNRLTRPLACLLACLLAFSVMRNFPLSSVKIIMIIYYIILHRNEKSGKAKNPPPSFPRKRESRPFGAETYRIKRFPASWIPTFVRMTGYRFHYGRVQITACAGRTGFQVAVFDFLFLWE
ncbi:pilS cassette [Neisseria meningitidis]|nr:pilS cassette [Neisseria meningitidis]CKK39681.1 pilS cassette [Neisseria meningitidis]